MKKNGKNGDSRPFRAMERKAAQGLPGIFSAWGYKLRQRFLPVLLAVCLGLGTYFAVDNELQAMGAYGVDKLTIYARTTFSEKAFSTYYKLKAKSAGLNLTYGEFTDQVDVQRISQKQMERVVKRHQESLVFADLPIFVVVTEENEVFNFYGSMAQLDVLLGDLMESGLLEVTE